MRHAWGLFTGREAIRRHLWAQGMAPANPPEPASSTRRSFRRLLLCDAILSGVYRRRAFRSRAQRARTVAALAYGTLTRKQAQSPTTRPATWPAITIIVIGRTSR